MILNVLYKRKDDNSNAYRTILHSENESAGGIMLIIEFDDTKELKGTNVITKADIVFGPLGI